MHATLLSCRPQQCGALLMAWYNTMPAEHLATGVLHAKQTTRDNETDQAF